MNSLGRALDSRVSAAQLEQLLSAGKGIPVRLVLDLPAGEAALRVAVLDVVSQRTGSLEIEMHVPEK